MILTKKKIAQYRSGIDSTKEVGDDAIKASGVNFTSNVEDLREASFHIIAVPTPLRENNFPDLRPLEGASRTVGKILKKGDYVVYESTVYPGATEEVCVPILEAESGLKMGVDFKVGYSPERINPGDKVHRLETIVKVVSGCDDESLDTIAKVYELVVEAGVHRAPSMKVAEAAKVIENSQRDINIAFMNELSMIFDRLNISTSEVLEAAGTKWNFLNFTPGLVGGHCIGIDPYYLTYKATEVGYHSQIILAGRKINDEMGKYVTENIIKLMVKNHIDIQNPKVAILGLTFKEDTPDTRNTKVTDIIDEFANYDIRPLVCDPQADPEEVKREYGIELVNLDVVKDCDVVVLAVKHEEFIALSQDDIKAMFKNDKRIFIDIKSVFPELKDSTVYWSL